LFNTTVDQDGKPLP
jgi:hypothetical protein